MMPTRNGLVSNVDHLSAAERHRYSRHLLLPDFGLAGQQRLKAASVLLVGAGGLGSPLAMYLAAAGVGRIGIVDFDVVDTSNLQRQILHGTSDVGRSKLASAHDRLREVNPHVQVDLHDVRLTSENALQILQAYDVVADGTDNFPTRYLVNDACVLLGKINVYASIFRFDGQVSVFGAPDGPCYRCVYPEPPPPGLVPSCAEGGVLGVLPGLAGTLQATEVIKVLTGLGDPLIGRLLLVDALTMQFRTLRMAKDPDCPVCGTHPTVTELIDYEAFCGISPEPAQTQDVPEISVQAYAERMAAGDAPFLLDVRQPHEYEIANLGGYLLPLDELADHLDKLPVHPDDEIVVHCRSGVRSAKAVRVLQAHGFRKAVNLAGGILAWSQHINAEVPTY